MAPACLATLFEGDNGGATSRGVTATEIRVGVMISSWSAPSELAIVSLFEHFNQRFELYGRRLVPVVLSGAVSDPVTARAKAAELASLGVFAVLTSNVELANSHAALPVELARQGIVTITRANGMAWSDRVLYDPLHPYVWSVYPSAEDVQANLAAFACTVLDDHPARFAGDSSLRTTSRRFGIVAASQVTPPPVGALTNELAACSGSEPLRGEITTAADPRSVFERLRSQGATTLICVCEDDYPQTVMANAHEAGFHPEWLFSSMSLASTCEDECVARRSRANPGSAAPIMLTPGPRGLPLQARTWFGPVGGLVAGTGVDFRTMLGRTEVTYVSLLVLASGIQGAGPSLSADTFGQALMTMEFPNPGAGQAPYWQPSVGFGPGDHSFYDDYTVAWWSDTAEPLDEATVGAASGSWCYLDQAARYRVGRYPADAESRLFSATVRCR